LLASGASSLEASPPRPLALRDISRFSRFSVPTRGHNAMGATEDDELPDFNPSIYKVVRELKRDDHGVYNCLASIVQDAAFVRRVVARYPDFPVFANLRCGVWYVGGRGGAGAVAGDAASADGTVDDTRAPAAGTCNFKSTDGHCNNWSFSATRLNLHVAEAAAKHGGCVIVDATRSTTKRFPDSFSKTIPTWAEVLNRAVVRAPAATAAHRDDDHDHDDSERDHDHETRARWTDGPHLPPWVAENERQRIRERVPGFQDQLASVHPNISQLAAHLEAPLRCVWVSQETRSLPCVRDRRAADDDDDEPSGDSTGPPAFIPLVLLSASAPLQWHGERRSSDEGYPYAYIPGAGDDEETWARGLDAETFWARRREIVDAGPTGCVAAVDRVTGGPVNKRNGGGGRRGRRVAGGPRGTLDAVGEGLEGMGLGSGPGSADLSNLAARGCLSPAARAEASARVAAEGGGALDEGGVRWLAEGRGEVRGADPGAEMGADSSAVSRSALRGVALGSAAALARPETWDAFDAVLYCGDEPPTISPGFESNPTGGDRDGDVGVAAAYPKPYLHVARTDVSDGLPAALAFLRARLGDETGAPRGRVLVACGDGVDHCVGVAVARLISEDARAGSNPAGVVAAAPVTKDEVRRRLAEVSARHPDAMPSRGTLKQVYNYLLHASKG
jgi:tRNA A64-2'-O-ribosylphosphate transferase